MHWVLQCLKRDPGRNELALSEMKNLHGTNSGENEAMNQTNDLEHKEKAFNQNSRNKKEFKTIRTGLRISRTFLNIPTSES